MESFLPLFPLNLVAFPHESLNLHVFEPRYKQLIKDALDTKSSFGIPSFIHKKIEYGTEVEIIKVKKIYEDGRLDIMTRGKRIFRVIKFINPLPDKLYAGGNIIYQENKGVEDFQTKLLMAKWVKELYTSLKLREHVIPETINSFEIGHKIGLSVEEEYELMKIDNEYERQRFIINHLKKAVPIVKEIERTKKRIKMNGHFKYLDPLIY
ncbi:LON peptidase substrate-binding domain-containing protein [soil metagenome]